MYLSEVINFKNKTQYRNGIMMTIPFLQIYMIISKCTVEGLKEYLKKELIIKKLEL